MLIFQRLLESNWIFFFISLTNSLCLKTQRIVSADLEQVISAVEEGPSNSNKTVVTEQQVTPPDAADGEAKTPVKEKRRRSHMFRRNRFTLHHSDYESD